MAADASLAKPAANGGMFASMRVPNFRRFFWGQLLSQIGTWLGTITQTLLVLSLTDSGVWLGALTATQFAPVLFLGPYAGLLADRLDKRKLLLVVQSLFMVQVLALAAVASMARPPLAAVFILAACGGVLTAFDNPARRSYVVELVPVELTTNAVSLNTALMTGSRIVGPALAGVLAPLIGFSATFALDGLSYVAVLFGLWRIDPTRTRQGPTAVKGRGQVVEGFRYAMSVPELAVPLAMMAVIGTFTFNFQVVLPLFATRSLGGTGRTFTVLYAITAVGSLAGALLAARRQTVTVRFVAVTALLFGAAVAVLAVMPNLWASIPVALVMGATSTTFMTSSTAIVQVRSRFDMRGRVLALQSMVFLGSTPIGGPIVGWVSEHIGARWGVGVGAVAALLAGGVGLLACSRRQAAVPAPPVPQDPTDGFAR